MSPDTIIAATRHTGFPEIEPGSFRALPLRAALFITLVVCTGGWLVLQALDNWNAAHPLHFLFSFLILCRSHWWSRWRNNGLHGVSGMIAISGASLITSAGPVSPGSSVR